MKSTVVTNSSTYPGRTRQKWKGNIKMDLKETGWEGMAWINLAQDRDRGEGLITTYMDLQGAQNACNFVIG